ncbi:hypothetical protein HK405_006210 [Cladochytrium tenue]|nr:hypothetical protein HK405_006210 [Cladochytrium tenue]
MPAVHALFGPEDAHRLSIWLAKHRLVPFEHGNIDEDERNYWRPSNPIGLAAGYDKHAEPGNATPRMFRLPQDTTVINRYGFNSDGCLARFYRLTAGAVPIIGCGGVATAADVLAFARAGASLVQVYTVFGYYGPGMVHDLKAGVVELLRKEEGGRAWREIVGKHRAAVVAKA